MTQENLIKTLIQAAAAGMDAIRSVPRNNLQTSHKDDYSPVTEADRRSHGAIQWILGETGIPVLSEEGAEIPYEVRKDWEFCWIVDPLDGTKEFLKGSDEYTVNIALLHKGIPTMGIIGIPERNVFYLGSKTTGAIRFHQDEIGNEGLPQTFQLLNGKSESGSDSLRVIASRSHLSEATANYIEELRNNHKLIEFVQAGSAIKFCMLAEGSADIYPRFSPCMEWDTAAGQVILQLCGKSIKSWPELIELQYNKPNLLNPDFIAQ
jgi:3'(2'), 5'-bisphosphate nucleotidase